MEEKDFQIIEKKLNQYQNIKNCLHREKIRKSRFNKDSEQDSLFLLNLLYNDNPYYLPRINEILGLFLECTADIEKFKKKVSALIIDLDNCLHTYSEIGLAKHFLENGYQLDFDIPYSSSHTKDIDLLAENDTERLYVEILNFKSKELDFLPVFGTVKDIDYRFRKNIGIKVKKKEFHKDLGNLNGKLFIALDWSKNHEIAAKTIANVISNAGSDLEALSRRILIDNECLDGIIFYSYILGKGINSFIKHDREII
jgi:hypothetical protein